MTHINSNLEFIEFSNGYLYCQLDASLPSIEATNVVYNWYKDDTPINLINLNAALSEEKKKLEFRNLTFTNNGAYKCVATIQNGQRIESLPYSVSVRKSKTTYE